jgi:hypothetical protein
MKFKKKMPVTFMKITLDLDLISHSHCIGSRPSYRLGQVCEETTGKGLGHRQCGRYEKKETHTSFREINIH